jgi:hypothetical protein
MCDWENNPGLWRQFPITIEEKRDFGGRVLKNRDGFDMMMKRKSSFRK